MRWRSFAVSVLLGTLSAGNVLADAPFDGRVFIKGSRDPLAQVNLYLLPQKLKSTTDENGVFHFDSVPGETATLIVNAPGFERFEAEFRLENRLPVEVFVLPSNSLDFETTIQSSEQRDSVKKTLGRKAAASQPGAGADPIRAVQNLPGVNRSPGFTSQVIIQGSAPQDTRYAIDGHEIPLIFHFGGLSSVFNPEATESFDFLSAGYQSNYGRAVGGILNLNSRDLKNKRTKGSAYVDTFNSGAFVETPVGERGQLAVGARISYIGQVLKAVFKNNENFDLTVAPSYGDLSLLYSRPLSPRLQFKLVGIGSSDSLEFISNNPLRNEKTLRGNFSSKIGFFRLIPEFEWTHSERSKTRFSFGLGRDFIESDIGSLYFNLATMQATVRAENKTRIDDRSSIAYGMDHRLTWADVSFKVPVAVDGGGIIECRAQNGQLDRRHHPRSRLLPQSRMEALSRFGMDLPSRCSGGLFFRGIGSCLAAEARSALRPSTRPDVDLGRGALCTASRGAPVLEGLRKPRHQRVSLLAAQARSRKGSLRSSQPGLRGLQRVFREMVQGHRHHRCRKKIHQQRLGSGVRMGKQHPIQRGSLELLGKLHPLPLHPQRPAPWQLSLSVRSDPLPHTHCGCEPSPAMADLEPLPLCHGPARYDSGGRSGRHRQ
ncbi:hypothetical protein EB061_04395 [bacterium]|nr:hypothetical protein [bacterium]